MFSWFRDPSYQKDCGSDQAANNCKEAQNLTGFQLSEFIHITPSDTLAQWIMAGLATLATGVSILAVILIQRTLRATAAAVDAASETNKIMRDDQRPWLVIEHKMVGDFLSDESASQDHTHWVRWSMDYDITNKGKSAGTKFQVWNKMICVDNAFNAGAYLNEFIEKTKTERSRKFGVVFPSEKKTFARNMASTHIRAESGNSDQFALLMVLRYTDTSGNLRGMDARCFVLQQHGSHIGPRIAQFRSDDEIRITE
ncbi:MAG: hypothetical protein V3V04_05300 [Rhizobiaceae bacterium]